jgi:hypothetical protein
MKSQNKKLSETQSHDVWEIGPVDEITHEVKKVMESLGLTPEETNKAMLKKEKKDVKRD